RPRLTRADLPETRARAVARRRFAGPAFERAKEGALLAEADQVGDLADGHAVAGRVQHFAEARALGGEPAVQGAWAEAQRLRDVGDLRGVVRQRVADGSAYALHERGIGQTLCPDRRTRSRSTCRRGD